MRIALASPEAVEEAARILRDGGLVAFPTETVYGLGARADDAAAVRRIYAAKGRPSQNPSIVHVADPDSAFALALDVPEVARALAARFWPGPLTLVLRRRPGRVVDEVTAFGDTLAVRVPAHPLALALCRAATVPIAAPSANASTAISPSSAAHVLKSLGDAVDFILDGGPTDRGIESTIIDCSTDRPRLLRYGSIPLESFESYAIVDDGGLVRQAREGFEAPGQARRHYSPSVPVLVVETAEMRDRVALLLGEGKRVGTLTWSELARRNDATRSVALEPDREAVEREFYDALHRLEDAGLDLILVEQFPSSWSALRDRLFRAAHS